MMDKKEKELMLRDVEQNVLYDSGLQYLRDAGGRITSMIGKKLEEGHSFVWDHGSFRVLFSSHTERCEAYMFVVNKDDRTLVTISVFAGNVFAHVGTEYENDIKGGRKNALARRAVSDAVRLLAGHSGEIIEAFFENL